METKKEIIMEFKGTKNQWKIEEVDKTFVYALNEKGTNAFSLKINNDGRTVLIEQQANALLISKAPEMLEMLEKCEYWISSCNEDAGILKDINKLIKEATEL